jgi:two-component system OmpR family sensor kinase
MMRIIRALVIIALPILVCLIFSALFAREALPNPVVYLRADLAALALLAGIVLSLLLAVGMLLHRWWAERAQQRAVSQARAKMAGERRRFLQRLDHELKNPLTAIRAGLTNLADAPNAKIQREALASVEAETLRLSRLTADLRKLAELETRTLERAPVHLAELLQEALNLAQEQPEAHVRRLTLTLPQAPWPLPPVSGDWDLLFLAVYNLLNNALKFTRPGDTVEMRAFEDGRTVVVEVADTGPGIPEAELPHVWEELYRGQGARGVPGSGLGLALVQAITERHGGEATLRSRAGQGTVVTLRLPAA